MYMNTVATEPICCPPFNPELWEDKVIEWNEKKFIRDHVRTFFYMPIGFGKTMKRVMAALEKAGAVCPDWICLSDHTSKWNMDILLAVDKEIPDAENMTLSGKFYSRVYEGPFKDTEKWCKDFETKAKGFEIKKWYMWYTTCPECAKKYGKNYVVVIGQI
jgi:hypothetical protein